MPTTCLDVLSLATAKQQLRTLTDDDADDILTTAIQGAVDVPLIPPCGLLTSFADGSIVQGAGRPSL